MIENPISSTSLYNQCSTLNYTQAAMMGLTGSSIPDSQQLGYGNHGNIPNIILTGSSTSTSKLKETCSTGVERCFSAVVFAILSRGRGGTHLRDARCLRQLQPWLFFILL